MSGAMTVALVVGVGEVGTRAARQLVDTPGFATILLADRDAARARERRRRARSVGARDRVRARRCDPARCRGDRVRVAGGRRSRCGRGRDRGRVPVASSDDEHDALEQLRALDQNARSSGVTVAIGCGLAPGLSDVLAAHAASLFESVDEIRVARTGWAGPASVDTVRHERRLPVRAWRDGGWREERSRGDALVFFPEPIGGRDCRVVTGATRLLVDAFPERAPALGAARRAAAAHTVPPPVRRRRRVGRGPHRGVGPARRLARLRRLRRRRPHGGRGRRRRSRS